MFGRFIRFLILRSRRNGKPVTWKAPLSLLERQLPWTMRELRPRVTEIRGNSAIHYRNFELKFEHFNVRIVLRGRELDEIMLAGPGEGWGTRIDHVQKELALRNSLEERQPMILNYGNLDEFLKANHEALNKYYSVGLDREGN